MFSTDPPRSALPSLQDSPQLSDQASPVQRPNRTASNTSLENACATSSPVFAGSAVKPRFPSLQLDVEEAGAAAAFLASPLISPINVRHFSFASSGYSSGSESLTSLGFLPQETRTELILLLDPEHPADWRLLADRLGFESKHIRWLECRKDSPTAMLLNWWETQRSRKVPMRKLAEVLRGMGRDDAAEYVEGVLPRETRV